MAKASFGKVEVQYFENKLSFSISDDESAQLHKALQRHVPAWAHQCTALERSHLVFYSNEDLIFHYPKYTVYCAAF